MHLKTSDSGYLGLVAGDCTAEIGDYGLLTQVVADPVIFDRWNLYDPSSSKTPGLIRHAIGRSNTDENMVDYFGRRETDQVQSSASH